MSTWASHIDVMLRETNFTVSSSVSRNQMGIELKGHVLSQHCSRRVSRTLQALWDVFSLPPMLLVADEMISEAHPVAKADAMAFRIHQVVGRYTVYTLFHRCSLIQVIECHISEQNLGPEWFRWKYSGL